MSSSNSSTLAPIALPINVRILSILASQTHVLQQCVLRYSFIFIYLRYKADTLIVQLCTGWLREEWQWKGVSEIFGEDLRFGIQWTSWANRRDVKAPVSRLLA